MGLSRKLSLRIPRPTCVAPFSHLKTSFGQPEWMRLSVLRRTQTRPPLTSTNSPVFLAGGDTTTRSSLRALAAERSVRKMQRPRWTQTLSLWRKSEHRLCYLPLQGVAIFVLWTFVVMRHPALHFHSADEIH